MLPIGCSILTEIIPIANRMMIISFISNDGIGFITGELVSISLAWVFLDNLEEGNWRGYLQTLSMVLLVTTIGIALMLQDSPRHFQKLKEYSDNIDIEIQ